MNLPKERRGEWGLLAIALVLHLIGIAAATRLPGFRWAHYVVFVPTGLWALAAVNVRLRSRILAWSVFTSAILVFMVILGAWALNSRAGAPSHGLLFLRSLAFYAVLGAAALFPLRWRTAGHPSTRPKED